MRKALLFLIVAGLLLAPVADAWAQKDIKWGTAAAGSAGHRALTSLAALAVAPIAAFVAYWLRQDRRIDAIRAASPEGAEAGAEGS